MRPRVWLQAQGARVRQRLHGTLVVCGHHQRGGMLLRVLADERHGLGGELVVVTIPLDHATTLYDRVGDWVPMASLGVLILAGVMIAFRRATIEPRRAQETRRKG